MPKPRKRPPLPQEQKARIWADLQRACERAREVGRQMIEEGLLEGRVENGEVIIEYPACILPPRKRTKKST
jgi:hypothetical protein